MAHGLRFKRGANPPTESLLQPEQMPVGGQRKQPSKRGASPALKNLQTGAENVAKVDAHGFTPWGLLNLGAGIVTVLSAFNINSPAELSAAISAGVLPLSLVDVLTTLLGNTYAVANHAAKTAALKEAQKKRREDGMGPFEYANASAAQREASGNASRAVFPFARDVVGGTAGNVARINTLMGNASLWGSNAGVAPDVAFGGLSCVTYVAAGILQSRKVDRAVDRVFRVNEAANRAANGRQNVTRDDLFWMAWLDATFERQEISPNVYETLRARSPQEVRAFLVNWNRLSSQKQERLTKLLHFSGAQKGVTAFNMTRTTNLNTASVRRAARDAVISAFIAKEVPERWNDENGSELAPEAAEFFDDLKTARKEALGAQVAPRLDEIKADLGAPACEQLGENAVRAIARSGHAKQFIERYRTLNADEKDELRAVFHFGSWRFWRSDATVPTTKYQRADIRAKLVERFAKGTSLPRLAELKVRYNQKVVPLRTVRTHSRPAVDNTMIHFVLAAQDTKLDALKEEKRDAKIKLAYGLANGAAALAEGVVNPGAVTGVSATRAILSAPYLIYAARRSLGNWINQRNAAPITAAMREDAVLCMLPDLKDRMHGYLGSKEFIRGLRQAREFLRKDVGLTDKQIDKALALERAGKMDALRAYLARKNPKANILIALRRMAEQPGPGDPQQKYEDLKASTLDFAARNPSELIRQMELMRLREGGREVSSDELKRAVDARKRQLAEDNPVLATRLFVDELASRDPMIAAGARNVLRELRFGEMEVRGLTSEVRKGGAEREKVAGLLQEHLLGENLRRRFSVHKLSKKARYRAANIAATVDLRNAPASGEALTWRHHFEKRGVDVIDNVGAPGLDSMLHALQQHFEGKTDCSSSKMRRKMALARQEVLRALPPHTNVDLSLAEHFGTIVDIASKAFGKAGASVLIRETYPRPGVKGLHELGGNSMEPAAVLCYDNQTNRTFVLDGVDEPPAPQAPEKRPVADRSPVPERRWPVQQDWSAPDGRPVGNGGYGPTAPQNPGAAPPRPQRK